MGAEKEKTCRNDLLKWVCDACAVDMYRAVIRIGDSTGVLAREMILFNYTTYYTLPRTC